MTILCYHAVEPDWDTPLAITPADFAAHMTWLARHRRVVPLDAALSSVGASGLLPRGTTAITFDDGFAGVYRYALPILSSLGVAARCSWWPVPSTTRHDRPIGPARHRRLRSGRSPGTRSWRCRT